MNVVLFLVAIILLGWSIYWIVYCYRHFYKFQKEDPEQNPCSACALYLSSCKTLQEQFGGVIPENQLPFFPGKPQCIETCPLVHMIPHGRVGTEENSVRTVASDDGTCTFTVHKGESAAGVDEDAGMSVVDVGVLPTMVPTQMGCDDHQIGESV